MTAPAAQLAGGLSIVPPSVPVRAAGALAREQWFRLMFGNGTASWTAARWGAATAAPTVTATTQSEAPAFVAGVGNVLQRGGYGQSRWQQDSVTLGGQLFDRAAVGPFTQPRFLVYRELLAFTRNTTADPNVYLGHGFSCTFDTEYNSGGIPLHNGTLGFLGYCYSPTTGTWFTIKKARGAAAVFAAMTGFDGSLFHSVEHRLIAPTLAAPAVYELRINDALVFRVLGTDAAFPLVDGNNQRYRPVGAASANYAGLSGGIRVARGDLFVCDGSADSLAYL